MVALRSSAKPIYIQHSNPAGHHVKPTKLNKNDYKTNPIQTEGVYFQIEDRYTQIQARNDVLADRNPSRMILGVPRLNLGNSSSNLNSSVAPHKTTYPSH